MNKIKKTKQNTFFMIESFKVWPTYDSVLFNLGMISLSKRADFKILKAYKNCIFKMSPTRANELIKSIQK